MADPNDLVGPTGAETDRWVSGTGSFPYVISFGNEATATAPAQRVVATYSLDKNLDVTTLKLAADVIPNGRGGSIQVPVSQGVFNPAIGLNEFKTVVDLRPVKNLLVDIDAKLDTANATLVWTFTSIDPATGLPFPFNLSDGFLPPGTGGSVLFTIRPKIHLATDTKIAAQASVIFNTNQPIVTNPWGNTIDNTPPISKVASLPATESSARFPVSWSGTDVGSGLQGFTIYVSDDRGQFTPWLTNTTVTHATYAGVSGHTYSFYSIARDLVGNVEGAKTTAEATTTVTGSSTCATDISSQVTITRGGFRFDHGTKSFVQA